MNCNILKVAMACTIQLNQDDSTVKSSACTAEPLITDKVMCSVVLLLEALSSITLNKISYISYSSKCQSVYFIVRT
jgi:hypothetical protein